MDNFRYVPDMRVVRSARNFIHSICEVYGTSKGMEVWDYIREGLDEQIASDIFLGMLTGNDTVIVKSIGQRMIEAIKEVRALTGWGLKESKDFVEYVRDRGPKTLDVAEFAPEKIDNFCRAMRQIGCEVE